MKSLKKRIEREEAYKDQITSLAKSDRALLMAGFEGIFIILAALAAIPLFVLADKYWSVYDPSNTFVFLLIFWCFVWGLVSVGCFLSIRNARQYPESLDGLDKRITNLKNKFLSRQKNH